MIPPQMAIINLWIVFLLGLLFHTQLGLMPLFHGVSVAESQANTLAELAPIFWLMLAFFVLPMAAIVLTCCIDTRAYRRWHFRFSLLYSVLNIAHLVADLMLETIIWYQIALMVVLCVIGLLINWVSFQWMTARSAVY